ncbi:MAG: hypothetical protein JNK64_29860 [Myxococcales bacterium]|nr:hypothetical protein [Myxococcales bacterium]
MPHRLATLLLVLATGVAAAAPPPTDDATTDAAGLDDDTTRYGAVAPAGVDPARWQVARAWIVALAARDVGALQRLAPRGVRVRVDATDAASVRRACRSLDGQRLAGRGGMRRLAACFGARAEDDLRAQPLSAAATRWRAWATDCSGGDQLDVALAGRAGRLAVVGLTLTLSDCEDP